MSTQLDDMLRRSYQTIRGNNGSVIDANDATFTSLVDECKTYIKRSKEKVKRLRTVRDEYDKTRKIKIMDMLKALPEMQRKNRKLTQV